MATKKQYEIDSYKKIVIANIAKLSETDLQAVKNYVALGFTLKEGTIKPKTKGLYTKANIMKFIKTNKIDFDFKKYENEINENGRKKGFINAQRAFRNEYEKEFIAFMEK